MPFLRVPATLFLSLALFTSGCVGAQPPSAPSHSQSVSARASVGLASDTNHGPAGEKAVTVYACEPKSLIPTNVNEPCGQPNLIYLFTPLVQIDDQHKPVFGDQHQDTVAQTITTSDDLKTVTITLKDGWTFHNGEVVDAQAYIRAWNFGANPKNAQENIDFYRHIQGFDQLQTGESTELSGLTALDNKTIQVTLDTPFTPFVSSLVHTAFFPFPKVATEDINAFNEHPIGNGPFKMKGDWQHDVALELEAYDGYKGKQPDIKQLTAKIYGDNTTAYNDLRAGNLDIIIDLPFEQADAFESELGDRLHILPSTNFGYLGLPVTKAPFNDKRIRQALSLAIDRETIASAIWRDTMAPADDYVNPKVAGYRKGACTYCTYDPVEAKRLFDAAGGIDEPIEVWFNAGAGHEAWIEAIANNWKQNLGIHDVTFKTLNTSDYLAKIDAGEYTGPYRRSWSADYPSMENYLAPLLKTGSEKNNTKYTNPAYDALIEAGNHAPTLDEAQAFYQQADDLALEDMPIIPVSFGKKYSGTSERIEGYGLDFNGRIKITEVMVRE